MKTKIQISYDPVVKRWKAECPLCGRIASRAKRESAEWSIQQHLAYEHEASE